PEGLPVNKPGVEEARPLPSGTGRRYPRGTITNDPTPEGSHTTCHLAVPIRTIHSSIHLDAVQHLTFSSDPATPSGSTPFLLFPGVSSCRSRFTPQPPAHWQPFGLRGHGR